VHIGGKTRYKIGFTIQSVEMALASQGAKIDKAADQLAEILQRLRSRAPARSTTFGQPSVNGRGHQRR
jgi:hypothetical protein